MSDDIRIIYNSFNEVSNRGRSFMKIKVFDYKKDYKLVDIPDDWEFIHVTVLSGDEVISVDNSFASDGSVDRMMDFFDGEYTVTREDFDKWDARTSAYNYLYGEDWD